MIEPKIVVKVKMVDGVISSIQLANLNIIEADDVVMHHKLGTKFLIVINGEPIDLFKATIKQLEAFNTL